MVRRGKRKGGKEGEKKETRRHSKGGERGEDKRKKEEKRGLHFQPCARWAGLESPWVEKSLLCRLIHFYFLFLCTLFSWFVLVI